MSAADRQFAEEERQDIHSPSNPIGVYDTPAGSEPPEAKTMQPVTVHERKETPSMGVNLWVFIAAIIVFALLALLIIQFIL